MFLRTTRGANGCTHLFIVKLIFKKENIKMCLDNLLAITKNSENTRGQKKMSTFIRGPTNSLMVRDDKNSHRDRYPRGFFPFREGMRVISYLISYSGKGGRKFFTQFLIRGGGGIPIPYPFPHFNF